MCIVENNKKGHLNKEYCLFFMIIIIKICIQLNNLTKSNKSQSQIKEKRSQHFHNKFNSNCYDQTPAWIIIEHISYYYT